MIGYSSGVWSHTQYLVTTVLKLSPSNYTFNRIGHVCTLNLACNLGPSHEAVEARLSVALTSYAVHIGLLINGTNKVKPKLGKKSRIRTVGLLSAPGPWFGSAEVNT